ncbi:MAG: hypothetical protein PHP50_10110 [Lachnospiraceae bacterium]|nr:hypothetical protein [Lachnospiraceae bacterium]
MEELKQYGNYQAYKKELDAELQKTAEGFVKIGYLLKLARDTDVLKDSPYQNVVEFAQAEYGIDKTVVSKWININDKFSEDGYSDRLKDQYQGFGYAKLAIMLQLPDSLNEELSPDFSKREIQTIKEEVDAEKALTPLEVALEGTNRQQDRIDRMIDKIMHQLGKDHPELYVQLFECVMTTPINTGTAHVISKLAEIMAPAGESIYSVRLQGVGRRVLSVKGPETEPAIIDLRDETGAKKKVPWDDIYSAIVALCGDGLNAKKSWELLYEEPYPEPEKPKVAPVQQNITKKPENKKPSKVIKAKTEEKPTETEEKPDVKPEEPEPEEKREDEPGITVPAEPENNIETGTDQDIDTTEGSEQENEREVEPENQAAEVEVVIQEDQKLLKTAHDLTRDLYGLFMPAGEMPKMADLLNAQDCLTNLESVIERLITWNEGQTNGTEKE